MIQITKKLKPQMLWEVYGIKKVVCAVLVFVLCSVLVSSESNPGSFPSLPDISKDNVVEKRIDINSIDINSEVYSFQKFNDVFLIQYQKKNSPQSFLCVLDGDCNPVMDYPISSSMKSLHSLGDEGVFILTAGGYTDNGCAHLDKDGRILWRMEERDGSFGVDAAFSDHEGGVYLFGNDDDHQCILFHIDRQGQIISREPFEKIENLSVTSGWPGIDGGYWLLGTRTTDKSLLFHLDSDFNVEKIFEVLENQYPHVVFFPEDDRIFLFGQAYKSDPWTEYGFVYEIDYTMNQKNYLEFDDCVPRRIIRLKDGRWLVSCYDRENVAKDVVMLFNADWKEVSTINIEYMYADLFALDDGGFAITGSRLSPGQSYESLSMSIVRPTLDLVYERFDAEGKVISRKTYSAEDSNSGYGSRAFVDTNGTLFLF